MALNSNALLTASQTFDVRQHQCVVTAEPVLTYTPRWMAWAMGYYRLWLSRGGLKIDSKAIAKLLDQNE